jgi:hypothetical protein
MEMVTCECGKRESLEKAVLDGDGNWTCEQCQSEGAVLPAITLYQPWAAWIMEGWKTIETREHDRFKSLLGETILIHAGLHNDTSPSSKFNRYLKGTPTWKTVNGCILGTALVSDVGWLGTEHSQEAMIDCGGVYRYGLFLENVEKFEQPIPVKGGMGIWYFNLNTKQKVRKHG